MTFTSTAIFEEVPPQDGGGYCACGSELPGANTQGATLEEARENLKNALQFLLETHRESTERSIIPGRKVVREPITVSA